MNFSSFVKYLLYYFLSCIKKDFSKNNVLTVTETIEGEGNTEIRRESYEYVYDGDYPTTVREFKEENNRKELKEITEYKY